MARDKALCCRVEDEELVIRIGIGTLALAAENCPLFHDELRRPDLPYMKVVDAAALAEDVVQALNDEQEDGTTPIHLMLDAAIEAAAENGSEGFSDESFD